MWKGKLKEQQIKNLLVLLAPVRSKKNSFCINIVLKSSTWAALAHSRGSDCIDVIYSEVSQSCAIVLHCIADQVSEFQWLGFYFYMYICSTATFICQWDDLRKEPFSIKLMRESIKYKTVMGHNSKRWFISLPVSSKHLCNWIILS